MKLDDITEKQRIQLFHADDPYKVLESWGVAADQTSISMWQIAADPATSHPPTFKLVDVLLDTHSSVAFAEHLALFQRLIARSYEPGYYDFQRREHYLALLAHMCHRDAEQMFAHLDQLPTPYDGLALLQLIAHEAIESIPEKYAAAVLCWHFQRSYEVYHLLRRIGDIKDYMDAQTWESQCLRMAHESSILSESSFPIEILDALDRETLVAIGAQQYQPHPRLTELLLAQGKELLPQLTEVTSHIEHTYGEHTRGAGLFPAYLQLLHEEQQAIPAIVMDWLTYEINELHYNDSHLFDFGRWLTLLPIPDAIALVTQWIRYNHLIQSIFGVIKDAQVFREVISLWREERPSSWHKENYVKGFVCGGDRAVEVICEALPEKQQGYVVALLSDVLKQIDTPKSTQALHQLLSHSSKVVRQDAIDGLGMRGDQALIGLEESLLSKKKATREAALQVLTSLRATAARDALIQQVLQETKDKTLQISLPLMLSTNDAAQDDPLHRVQTFANNITEERHTELLAIADAWIVYEDVDDHKADKAAQLQKAGLEALLCRELGQSWSVTELWGDLLKSSLQAQQDPLTPWVAVYAITQVVRPRRWGAQRLREGLDLLGSQATEALCALALHGNNQTILLEQLAKIDATAGISVFVKALEASSKGIREAAQEGLRQAGPHAAEALHTALSSDKKTVRLAAAELLKHLDTPATLEALEAAFATEANADVAALLQHAINHHSEQQVSLELADTTEAEAFLCETQAIRLPPFLDVDALPPLRWASGEALTPEATLGWLYQLALEAPGQPNQAARALRPQLEPHALSTFGEALRELFFANRKPTAYRWLKWQVSICGSPQWMYDFAEYIDPLDFPIVAQHGSRLSALLLHSYQVSASKRKARELYQEAIDAIPREHQPTQKEREIFQREIDAIHVDNSDCEALEAGGQDPDGEYNATWKLRLLAFPALGELVESVTVDLVSFALCEGIEPHREPQLLRKAQVDQAQHTAQIESYTAQMSGCIDLQSTQRWSTVGWRKLFVQHPLWRLCGQGLVFATEAGERLMCGVNGEPINAAGETISLDADGFLHLVPLKQLSAKERAIWQARLDQRHQAWKAGEPKDISAQTDSDPLMELRALLSEEPTTNNWEAVCHLVESWPEDGTLALGLSYIEAHADEHWGTQERTAPAHWVLSLLDPANKARRQKTREGQLIADPMQEYLRTCNHLSFVHVDLTLADAKRLADASCLTHITGLHFERGRWYKGADQRLLTQVDFSAVRRFALHSTKIRGNVFSMLSQSPWLQQLTHLSLRDCDIDWQRLQLLCDGGLLDDLVSLDLRDNPLALPGIQLLTGYKGLEGLKELKLFATDLDDNGLIWLAENNPFAQLEVLHLMAPLYWHDDTRDGVEALAASQRFPHLTTLHMWDDAHNRWWREVQQDWIDTLLGSKTLPAKALESLRQEQDRRRAEHAEEQAQITGLSDFR